MHQDLFSILLIEDDPNDEEIALRALRNCGLRLCVRVARDGAEGLHALGLDGSPAEPPDLVLSDVKMPKVDGPEVLRRVRADERLQHLPFVLLSSSGEDRDVCRAQEYGASEYRTKPIGYAECTTCVQEIARRWLEWRNEGANVRESVRVYVG